MSTHEYETHTRDPEAILLSVKALYRLRSLIGQIVPPDFIWGLSFNEQEVIFFWAPREAPAECQWDLRSETVGELITQIEKEVVWPYYRSCAKLVSDRKRRELEVRLLELDRSMAS